jgi:hypothetical protein
MKAQIPAVPVGTTSKAGYGVTAFALASAVIAYATGDHSQQTTGVIVAGAVAALSFLVTQAGRYAQAHALAVNMPTPKVVELRLDGQTIATVPHGVDALTASGPPPLDDEPGDPHDSVPHHPVTDPRDVPPDNDDGIAHMGARA